MDISCAAEGDFVPHSAAMLHSALEHSTRGDTHVHYLHGPDLTTRSARRLAQMINRQGASVSFVEVSDERCVGLPTKGFTRKATWYKLFLPELLPEVARVLHLDSDTIALDTLKPLWSTNLDGNYLAAVTNILPPLYGNRAARGRIE